MMAGWNGVLDTAEVDSVVSFLQNWDAIEGEGLLLTPPEPIRIDLDNPQEVLALGERIYSTACIACHGENGSGDTGPTYSTAKQVLSNKSDEQIRNTIINGGHRPNSSMPAFGDRMTAVEIDALVSFVRAWEPTAPWVENPRGTSQGGGPPWLRATPDPEQSRCPRCARTGSRPGTWWPRGWPLPGEKTTARLAMTNMPYPKHRDRRSSLAVRVVTADGNALTFIAADGSLVEAMLGPPWFWSESGILLTPGDKIELEGFESPDHMELNWITNITTGKSIRLRTPEGMPVWNQ